MFLIGNKESANPADTCFFLFIFKMGIRHNQQPGILFEPKRVNQFFTAAIDPEFTTLFATLETDGVPLLTGFVQPAMVLSTHEKDHAKRCVTLSQVSGNRRGEK